MDWYVGERDEVGVSWPLDWSALGAARSGQGVYARAGFSATRLTYVRGDHYSYQFAQLLEQSLNKAQARPSNAYTLAGAIGIRYRTSGGSQTYGDPTGNEYLISSGGVVQHFTKNYSIYWHPSVVAHPVWLSGGIGAKYRSAGYERGYGFPNSEEQRVGEGVVQKFARADGRVTALYWTPQHHRVHDVWEPGAIAAKFRRMGGINAVGFPSSDETLIVGGGVTQTFQHRYGRNTIIVWSESTGTTSLNSNGGLYWHWRNNGYTTQYGFPKTDETLQGNGTVTVDFSKGHRLTWSPNGRITESRI